MNKEAYLKGYICKNAAFDEWPTEAKGAAIGAAVPTTAVLGAKAAKPIMSTGIKAAKIAGPRTMALLVATVLSAIGGAVIAKRSEKRKKLFR